MSLEETVTADVWEGIYLGIRDYLHKNGFTDAIIGVSGGTDSAVITDIAMPGPFSSDGSITDA